LSETNTLARRTNWNKIKKNKYHKDAFNLIGNVPNIKNRK